MSKAKTNSEPEVCVEQPLPTRIEALLMAGSRPITEARIGELLGINGKSIAETICTAIEELNGLYENSARAAWASSTDRSAAGVTRSVNSVSAPS